MYKRGKRLFIVLMLSVFFVGSFTQSAHAEVLGGKWEEDIVIFVPWAIYSNPDLYSPFISAKLEWNAALFDVGADILIYEQGTDHPAFNVIMKYEEVPGPALGYGEPGPNPFSGTYTEGEIKIDPAILSYYPNDFNKRKAVFVHEIGHILGLKHAPDGTNSVMVETVGLHEPTQYDIDDLDTLYGWTPF